MARQLPAIAFITLLIFVGGLFWAIPEKDWSRLLIYLPILAVVAVYLYKVGIKPVDSNFPAALFIAALMAKLTSTVVRYWMLRELYNMSGDAIGYHKAGRFLAPYYQAFDFSVMEQFKYKGEGTTNFAHLTGLLYSVLPPSLPGSYFFFAMLALAGSVLFYRAFRIGFPESNPRFYRLIIFFLPSVLFWPSSLGKDAWIFFGSGIVAYGVVKYFCRAEVWGLFLTGLGILFIYPIRSQMALIMILAVVIAFVFSFLKSFSSQHPILTLCGVGLIVGGGMFIVPSTQETVQDYGTSIQEFEASYDEIQQQTSKGNSGFATESIFSPVGLAMGITTVLFRPFPWEAHNAQAMVTALEASVWLYLVIIRRRVFWARIRFMRRDPWIIFFALYALVVILGLSSIGNFGILARQRTLLLPFFWMLFA